MPNPLLTEIVVLLDRSGSMSTIRADMIGGFAAFVEGQKPLPGQCVLSLYMFDNGYDAVFEETPIALVGELPLAPRGGTALLDALGRCIKQVGWRLAHKPEAERPGKVVFLVITDGQENASREWTREAVKKLIEHQESAYNWQFVFLAANIDTVAEGEAMGFKGGKMRSYQAQGMSVKNMYEDVGVSVQSFRGASGSNAQLNVAPEKKLKDD